MKGGRCIYETGGFRCGCRAGFAGGFCQDSTVEDRVCSLSPCGQAATCLALPTGGFQCACPEGLTGRRCTVVVGACTSRPCLNGSSCVDVGIGLYRCSCPRGYSGPQCKGNGVDTPNAVTVTNGSEEVTSKRPSFTLLLPFDDRMRFSVFASLGACVLLTLVTATVACLVLRRRRRRINRRRTQRQSNVEADRDEDAVLRCLNNHSTLQLEATSSSKTVVAEQRMLLPLSDDKKNFLLEIQNEERLSRKSKTVDCNSVTNF